MSCASRVSAGRRGDAALAGARGGCGVVAGARSSGAGPGDPGASGGEGGGRPGRREGSTRLLLMAQGGLWLRRVGEGAGGGRGTGAAGVCSRSGLGGLGSQSREKRGACSADPPPFVRARSLGLLGETGTMGECLCGFEGSRVRPSPRRVLKALRRGGGRDLLCCPPTLWKGWVPGEGSWRLTADHWECGEQSAFWSRGPGGDPRSALERAGCVPGPARGCPPGSGGLSTAGGQGAGGLGRFLASPAPARGPFTPKLCSAGLLGSGREGGVGVGGRWQLGCCSSRGGFSPFRAPAYLHLCPFAGCSRQADPDPLLSDRVKTGTLLTIVEDNK